MFFIWQGFCHLVIGKKRQIDLKNFRFVIKTALAFYTQKTDRTYCPVCCSYSLSLPICISTKSSTLSASTSLDLMPSKARWRTHDWSHGLPTVRQAFLILRPGYTFHSVVFPASSVRCIAFRPCLTQTLCQTSLRWQSYCGAGFKSGLSPRLPRFPEVPLLCHLVSSVSGVLVYMWPVLPVAGLIVTSEESVWRFVCYRETDDTASYARVYQTRAGFPTPTHAYNYFKTDGQLKLDAVFPPVDNFYPFVLEHLYSEFIYVLLSIDITVMPGSTLRAYPLPDTQILNICILIPAAAAGLWWWIPSADFSEIFTSTLHFILYHR